jgi:hypothetical protein
MPDNLSISIGVDTAKLRADLEVLKAQFKDATQNLKRMAEEANKTGDMTRVQQAAKDVDALSRAIAADTRVLREQTAALRGVGVAATTASRGMENLAEHSHRTSREVFTLSRDLGKLEISGVGIAKVFREMPSLAIPIAALAGAAAAINKLTEEASKNIGGLENLHQAISLPKNDILAMQQAFRNVNAGAENVEPILRKMAEDFTKAHLSAAGLESAVSGVRTLRGGAAPDAAGILRGGAIQPGGFGPGGVLVGRGGQPMQLDATRGFAGILDQSQYANTAKGQLKYLEDAVKILAQIDKTNHQLAIAIAGAQAGGKDPELALRGFLEMARPGAMGATRAGAVEDPAAKEAAAKANEAYEQARSNFKKAIEDIVTTLGTIAMPNVTKFFNDVTKVVHDPAGFGQQAAQEFQNDWTAAMQGIASGWARLRDYMVSNPLPAPVTGSQEGQVIPLAKAGGGLIPGIGSGDTVPAMLTPGEFVNRRASVDYYGRGIFSALNNRMLPRDLFSRMGFAAGGLVGDRLHFADGGIVGTTSGGTPVHLHLDGQQFVMSAADHVASALVAVSQRYQMRSAGVKPSWYGGRPGG